MVEGLRYVRRNRLVLGAISARPVCGAARRGDGDAARCSRATSCMPAPKGSAQLRAAPAVGATLTALFFSWRPLKHNVGVKMLRAVGRIRRRRRRCSAFDARCAVAGLPRAARRARTCSRSMSASRWSSSTRPMTMRGRVAAVSGLVHFRVERAGRAESGLLGALHRPGRRGDRVRRRRRDSGRLRFGPVCFPNCACKNLRSARIAQSQP